MKKSEEENNNKNISDSEEEEEICSIEKENEIAHNKRQYLLQKKQPITSFVPGSLEKLPNDKRLILENNMTKIFQNGITYQEQIETVISLIHSPDRKEMTGQTAIGRLFGITKGAVHSHVTRMKKNRSSTIGRPSILNQEQNQIVCDYIYNCYIEKQSPNFYTLSDMIFCKFNIYLDYHSIYNFIRNSSSMKTVLAPVYESTRADVDLNDLIIYYEKLDNILLTNKIHPTFVFNVDESGFIDFIDMRNEIVIVPIYAVDGTVIGAERNSKRSTMVGAIALDGTRLMPMIVLANKRYDKELTINGYGDQNVVVVYQENGFINSRSFSYWNEEIFIPELKRRRMKYQYDGEAILLLDGCTSHTSDIFLDECSFQNVYPFFEPAGSSDQVQALDLGIFGIQKCLKTKIKTKPNISPSSKNVIQIVNSWIKTTTPDVVVSAFNQAGIFVTEQKDGSLIARASIEKARAVRNIQHQECHNIITGNKTTNLLNFDE